MASVQLTSVFLVLISYVLIVVSSSYPGISAVITKGFLDETSRKLERNLASLLLQIPPFGNVTQELDVGGTIRMFDTKVTRVTHPQTNVNLIEPNSLEIEVKLSLIVTGGRWHLVTNSFLLGEIDELGTYVARLQQLHVNLKLNVTHSGLISIDQCEVTAERITMAFKGQSSTASLMNIRTSDQSYQDYMIESINNHTCTSVAERIELYLNPLMTNPILNGSDFFNWSLPISLDISMSRPLIITRSRIELAQNWQFYYSNQYSSSSSASANISELIIPDKLFSVSISDSVPNSFIKALYLGNINYILNKKNLGSHGDFLRTKCDQICFGYLSSDLGVKFPNDSVELVLSIGPDSNLNFQLDKIEAKIDLNITARLSETQFLAEVRVKSTLLLRPKVDSNKIHTTLKIERMTAEVKQSEIPGLPVNSLQDLLEFVIDGEQDSLEEFLNSKISKGFHVPKGHFLTPNSFQIRLQHKLVVFDVFSVDVE